jgi:PAS domain S-box-containing protein
MECLRFGETIEKLHDRLQTLGRESHESTSIPQNLIDLVWGEVSSTLADLQSTLENRLALQDQLLENAHDALISTDSRLQITFWNQAAEELYGWTEAQALGRSYADLLEPEADPSARKIPFEQANQSPFSVEEVVHHTRDGRRLVVEARIHSLKNAAGQLTGYAIALRDVTAHKLAKARNEQLHRENRRQEVLLEAIFDADPAGLAVVAGLEMRLMYANPAYRFIAPHNGVDLIGQTYATIWSDRDPNCYSEPLREVIETGRPFQTLDFTRQFPDGAQRTFTLQARRIEWGDQPAALIALWDTTELHQAQLQIRLTESKLTDFMETTHDALFTLDREWRFVYANRHYGEIFEKDARDLVGQNFWEVFPRYLGTPVEGHYRTAMMERVPVTFESAGFYSDKWYEISIYPTQAGISVFVIDRTEEKQAERLLRESEARQRTTLASIGDAVITTDAHGTVTYLNPVAETLTGWSSAEASGLPLGQVFPIINEETSLPAQDPVGKVLREGLIVGLANHTALLSKDHRVIPIEDSAAPIKNADGEMLGVVMVFHDVTEKRKAEESVRLSEEKFAKAFAINPAAVAITRLGDGRIIEVNETWEAMFGYRRDEVLGTSISLNLWPTPQDRARLVQVLREKGSFRGVEQVLLRRSGEPFWTLASAEIITIAGEEVIVSTWLDITERKRAEQALYENEQRYRGLFETMQEALFAVEIITDQAGNPVDWRYLDVNPQTERLMSLTYDQMVGHTYREIVPHPDSAWITLLGEVARTGEPTHQVLYAPARDRWLQVNVFSPRTGQAVVLSFDVTDRKAAEAALRASQERFSEFVESSHDTFYVVDRRWNFVYTNRQYQELYQKDQGQLLGKNLWAEFPFYLGTLMEENYRKAMEDRVPVQFEFYGQVTGRWYDVSVYPSQDGISIYAIDITLEKQTDEKNAFQLALLERVQDAVIASDTEFTISYWNRIAEEVFGYTEEEALGRKVPELLHSRFPMSREKAVQQLLETGHYDGEADYQRKDGAYFTAQVRTATLLGADGKLIGFVSSMRNITDRKAAETAREQAVEALLESEHNYRNLFDTMPQGVVFQEADGTIVWINPAAERILGKTKVEFLGQTSVSVEHDTLREDGSLFPGMDHPAMVALRTGQTVREVLMQVYHPRKMEYRWILISAVPRFREGAAIPHQVYTVFEDITERKQAEQAIAMHKMRLEDLLESIQDGFMQLDREWRFTYVNPRAAQSVNREPQALLGKNLWETFPAILGTDQERIYRQVMETRQPAHTEAGGFMSKRSYDFHVYPTQEGISVFLVDITKRKRSEEEGRAQLVQIELQRRLLEQREQERLQIARDLHDGPVQELTAAALTLQVMILDSQNPNQTRSFEALKANLQSALSELRGYAQDLRPPILSKFGLEKAIQAHLETFQEKHPELSVQFEAQQEDEVLPESMRVAIYRIYQESLTNIVKHARATQVTIRLNQTLDEITLTVQDNGLGFEIPTDWLELARTGHLGLVGMRERAEAMDGKLEIRSASGEGLSVQVSVPLHGNPDAGEAN